ncbi:hypothetical protein M885DRAFT_540489 [Pelagophyceae sp. CCMP2097]|nr:hypothetical protein M885DRAFT_540489 [Pelagophyceae sp. CCMP2097]
MVAALELGDKAWARSNPEATFKYRDQSRMQYLARRQQHVVAKRWAPHEVRLAMQAKLEHNLQMAKRGFQLRDVTNSGFLGRAEIRKMIAWFNIEMTDEDFEEWWATVDIADRGSVDAQQFFSQFSSHHVSLATSLGASRVDNRRIYKMPAPRLTPQQVCKTVADRLATNFAQVQKAFLRLDKDYDGLVDEDEMQSLLTKLNISLVAADFDAFWAEATQGCANANGAAALDYKRFCESVGGGLTQMQPQGDMARGGSAGSKYDRHMNEIMKSMSTRSALQQSVQSSTRTADYNSDAHGNELYGPSLAADGHMGAFVGSSLSGVHERQRAQGRMPRHKFSTATEAVKLLRQKFVGGAGGFRKYFRTLDGQDTARIPRAALRTMLKRFLINLGDDSFDELCSILRFGSDITFDEFRAALGGDGSRPGPAPNIEWGVSTISNDRALKLGFFDVKDPLCLHHDAAAPAAHLAAAQPAPDAPLPVVSPVARAPSPTSVDESPADAASADAAPADAAPAADGATWASASAKPPAAARPTSARVYVPQGTGRTVRPSTAAPQTALRRPPRTAQTQSGAPSPLASAPYRPHRSGAFSSPVLASMRVAQSKVSQRALQLRAASAVVRKSEPSRG